ncbi:MAG: PilN domain-containing protein [Cyanobacteria bacterium P01_A01_bin.3]
MHTPDINFLRQRQDRYSPVPSERSAVSSSVSSGLLGGVNAILIGVAISFLLLGAYAIADFTFRRRLATLEEEQSTVTQDLASAQAELGQLRSLETELSAINDRTQAFQSFFNDVQPWSAILEDIRNQTPPDVWLTSISADSNTVNIAGQATRFQSVNDFQLTLLQSPLIANAVLESAVLSEDEENEGIGVVDYQMRVDLTSRSLDELLDTLAANGSSGLVRKIEILRDLEVQ